MLLISCGSPSLANFSATSGGSILSRPSELHRARSFAPSSAAGKAAAGVSSPRARRNLFTNDFGGKARDIAGSTEAAALAETQSVRGTLFTSGSHRANQAYNVQADLHTLIDAHFMSVRARTRVILNEQREKLCRSLNTDLKAALRADQLHSNALASFGNQIKVRAQEGGAKDDRSVNMLRLHGMHTQKGFGGIVARASLTKRDKDAAAQEKLERAGSKRRLWVKQPSGGGLQAGGAPPSAGGGTAAGSMEIAPGLGEPPTPSPAWGASAAQKAAEAASPQGDDGGARGGGGGGAGSTAVSDITPRERQFESPGPTPGRPDPAADAEVAVAGAGDMAEVEVNSRGGSPEAAAGGVTPSGGGGGEALQPPAS